MRKNCYIIICLCLPIFYSCNKNGENISKPLHVYIAGYVHEYAGQKQFARYWKDGVAVNLTDGSKPAMASSIVVSGNDVYVAGWELESTGSGDTAVAKYWKNGNAVSLTDGSKIAYATSIAVSGSDV